MAAIQIMIDQLESQAASFDEEIVQLDQRLHVLAAEGIALTKRVEQLRETQIHYKQAASNLVAVLEIENPIPETKGNPWGEADS